ncbi:MAG: hypothetical protein KJ747_02390, partial [Actinobacteria bacterium]|nr:hypothetical protein [Actinomycetota bacterium]
MSEIVAPVPVPVTETPTVQVPDKEPAINDPEVELPVLPEVIDPATTPAKELPATGQSVAVLAEEVAVPQAAVEVLPVTVAAIAPLGVVVNTGGGPRADFPAPTTVGAGCDLTTIAIFWAGQNYEAGTVSVRNDADNLYVTFATTGGWTMGLTHLYVGLTQPSTYAPGQFPYQTTHSPAVTSYTYTISLAGLGAVPGDTIYVAAHAEVHNGTQSETAWAGQGQWPGLLFAHVVQECVDEPDPADLTVTKFNDLNGNGEMDEGEPVISGIDFTATMGQTVLSQTTDAMGEVTFVDLADGTYTITETLPEGWVATTEIPFDITVVADQDASAYVGNREVVTPEDVTKTFRLVYPSAHFGVTFYAGYTMGEESSMVELTGPSPYEAQVQFPYGTEITVSWYALYGSELVLLGSGEPEVLTMDVVNVYDYAASVAGYKFNDLDADGVWGDDEPGIGGWVITLYRQTTELPTLAAQAIPADFEYYAATTTMADGSYLFSGVLPGTYYVAEENRAGWIMTVGTDGAFEVSNGAMVDGLIFGNAEEGLPFTPPDLAIEKAADVTTSSPGALITYTLTYRNVGSGSASDYRIVDDFDERYVAVVDSGGG